NTLGHGHPKLTRAIAEQSSRLIHTSNLYRIAEQERLADKLAAISGMDSVFFCNSGCEANEAAIKLARLYGHGKGVEGPGIVSMGSAAVRVGFSWWTKSSVDWAARASVSSISTLKFSPMSCCSPRALPPACRSERASPAERLPGCSNRELTAPLSVAIRSPAR